MCDLKKTHAHKMNMNTKALTYIHTYRKVDREILAVWKIKIPTLVGKGMQDHHAINWNFQI